MDSAFIERLRKIQLTEEEGEVIQLNLTHREKTIEECSLTLLGRFLTNRPYNQRAAKSLLRSVWKLGNDLRIVDVGEGLFQFRFKLESQLTWVLENGPWSFDNNLLVLRRWERGMTANSVTFSTLPIWVQVWGLPFDLINEEAGWEIGKGFGHVYEVDNKTFLSDQARFIRIRVGLSLNKPIRRGGWIANPEGDRVRVGFKYERLVGFCYQCGLLGHEMKDCSVQEPLQQAEKPYGDWLKAGARRKDTGAERNRTTVPPPEMTPEPPQSSPVAINSQAETAGSLRINCSHEWSGNGPELNGVQSQVTTSQNIQVSEEINTEQLRGAAILETDSIHDGSNKRTELMGMEITGLETAALDRKSVV